ncbi:MAG: hypothetical protein QM762_10070 [Chryseolinea sp.]
MKFVTKWRSLIALFAAVLVLSSCGGDDNEKSEEEVQLDKLKGTWTMTSVENDGVDRSDEYPNMTMTLNGTYTSGGVYNLASNADEWPSISPWKADDTWKFNADTPTTIIIRQSDLQALNYTLTSSDSQLKIEFNYSGAGFNNGRTSSVGGNWVFTFSK